MIVCARVAAAVVAVSIAVPALAQESKSAPLAKQLTAFNDLVNNTESLVQAISNKDAAATKKYSDAVQAGIKTLTALQAALPADYEVKTFAHLQKGYDAAIKSLKG